LPATLWNWIPAMLVCDDQLAPPSVDRNEAIWPELLSNGTITAPPGWTTGCPPSPNTPPAGATGVPQVLPPSVEVLM